MLRVHHVRHSLRCPNEAGQRERAGQARGNCLRENSLLAMTGRPCWLPNRRKHSHNKQALSEAVPGGGGELPGECTDNGHYNKDQQVLQPQTGRCSRS